MLLKKKTHLHSQGEMRGSPVIGPDFSELWQILHTAGPEDMFSISL